MLLLVANTVLLARPQLHDLDIKVVLSRNGDARITETRLMSIDSEGTECYIGLANMGESEPIVEDDEVRHSAHQERLRDMLGSGTERRANIRDHIYDDRTGARIS